MFSFQRQGRHAVWRAVKRFVLWDLCEFVFKVIVKHETECCNPSEMFLRCVLLF
jgi:hypothetical protein